MVKRLAVETCEGDSLVAMVFFFVPFGAIHHTFVALLRHFRSLHLCQISILYVVLHKFYPFHTWENVKSLHFSLDTKWDSGFAEVSLRRSPRIKQLSFSRTNSGSFYSGSQPTSRSVQRVHSFQQEKSGKMLVHLLSEV